MKNHLRQALAYERLSSRVDAIVNLSILLYETLHYIIQPRMRFNLLVINAVSGRDDISAFVEYPAAEVAPSKGCAVILKRHRVWIVIVSGIVATDYDRCNARSSMRWKHNNSVYHILEYI